MKREVIPGLWIGDIEACREVDASEFAVVHACKYPCYHAECGQRLRGDPKFFAQATDKGLFLNIIDPPTPLFDIAVFEAFLKYASEQWIAGRKLLIHCNKGESRAPSLALVFLAKCLGQIPVVSYDDAWDAFEQLLGIPYVPGRGIEDWLRIHWHELRNYPAAYIPGAAQGSPAHGQPPQETITDLSQISDEELSILVQGDSLVHFAGFVTIEDKKHERIVPVPNIYQIRIADAYQWCLEQGIPPRLMGLKPRQVGSSTFFGHLCYHHARRFHCDGIIIGDEASRTEKVWQIFTQYSDHDTYPWSSTVKYNTEKCKFTYSDGQIGEWEHDTANDPKAGISGTRQGVWFTEAARYAKTGVRTDTKVVTAVLNSLAKVPHSLAVAESTAEGAAGWFFENWQEAVTLEEAKAGKMGNGWLKIFAAWFEFPEHRMKRSHHTEQYFKPELSDREKRGVALYKWDAEQIAWRRAQILNECANDERMFDQDFPENDVDCFLSSGRPRFNSEGVARLEIMAKNEHALGDIGVLQGGTVDLSKGPMVSFRLDKEEGYIWIKQHPKDGASYIAFIDPCTGEQSKGARYPDAHAAGIIRTAYIDPDGNFHRDELVACIHVENGCRWDETKVAKTLVQLSEYYGNCMIVPETGNGLGVLVKLKDFGARLYQREKFDKTVPGLTHDVDGWETNTSTRDIWVSAMADAIREQTYDCCYKPAVDELRTFIIDERGKAQAKPGKHDDWVSGPAIALACRRFASVYRRVVPRIDYFGSNDRHNGSAAFS